MIACGFEVCAANPRIWGLRSKSSDPMFACAILGLLRHSSDPRFAQQNPRMVRIRTLRLTYTFASLNAGAFLCKRRLNLLIPLCAPGLALAQVSDSS